MTEAEWLACDDPMPGVEWVMERQGSKRKLRLFAVACCRRIWHLLSDERSRRALEETERFADGLISVSEQSVALERASAACDDSRHSNGASAVALATELFLDPSHPSYSPLTASYCAAWALSEAQHATTDAVYLEERQVHASVLRDIFGNPFRPVAFDPAWRTSTVVALASQMYESRDFTAMPILADALQDVECDNDDILGHCRDPKQVHVRGCWVVDLVLGKT